MVTRKQGEGEKKFRKSLGARLNLAARVKIQTPVNG